jgi:N-dimethylarginine dimethylaminohydrolase
MIYESVKHRLPIGFEQYAEAVKDYDIVPMTESGKVIGGVMLKGNEIHVGLGERIKASARRYIRECLNRTLDKYGFALTSVQAQNSVGLHFCQRLGFTKVGEANGTILLRCDRSNYK